MHHRRGEQRDRIARMALSLGDRARRIVEALAQPTQRARTIAGSRWLIEDLRRRLDGAEVELALREGSGLEANDILATLGRMARSVSDLSQSNVRVCMVLANCVEHASNTAAGLIPRSGPSASSPPSNQFDPEEQAAFVLAARTQGVAGMALQSFAELYPEHAVRLDREVFDALVTLWHTGSDGGKWVAVANVCKKRLGFTVSVETVKSELKKLKRQAHRNLGPG